MKRFLFFSFFSLLTSAAFSQVGISVGAQFVQATEWEEYIQETYNNSNVSIFPPSVYVGLDYWFRLKNKRIEFTPEIGFASYSGSLPANRDPLLSETDTYKSSYFSFYFNSNIYLLDFGGDCNCPTFNKDGDLIKKGFFIRLSPGIIYNTRSQTIEGNSAGSITGSTYQEESTNFSFRAGLGLDIGVSPFLTVTPLLMATYNTPVTWNHFTQEVPTTDPVVSIDSQVLQLFAGIRIGFRFDEINKYGYR